MTAFALVLPGILVLMLLVAIWRMMALVVEVLSTLREEPLTPSVRALGWGFVVALIAIIIVTWVALFKVIDFSISLLT